MAAYVLVSNKVLDESTYEEFRERVVATVNAHGGRYLARGGSVEVVEGDFSGDRVVVIEFENVDKARACLNSPEYVELKKIRQQAANATVLIVEGV